ncbi:hypothetical protein LIT25_07625 [Bacillus sp. F19]|nr:hypothetical protein LIT25_16125 [Bacillus sp. F19]USK35174.1 hypothetical protein LIT25_07625 [Bacillus sp. F19]
MTEKKEEINKELSERDRDTRPAEQGGSGNEAKNEAGTKDRENFSSLYGEKSTGPSEKTTDTQNGEKSTGPSGKTSDTQSNEK